jgi:thiamine pyrophosphokinase
LEITVRISKVNRCVVILPGGRPPFHITEGDLVICADGGALSILSEGSMPDILVGDMDSLTREQVGEMKEKGVILEVHPREKDLADGELAVRKAVSYSPGRIDIFGGKSGRSDHILSSFHLLFNIPRAIESVLHLENDDIILIREGFELLAAPEKPVVSVLPASPQARITIEGLKWDLVDHTLELGSTLGIHNELRENRFRIKAEKGDIYLILADE